MSEQRRKHAEVWGKRLSNIVDMALIYYPKTIYFATVGEIYQIASGVMVTDFYMHDREIINTVVKRMEKFESDAAFNTAIGETE